MGLRGWAFELPESGYAPLHLWAVACGLGPCAVVHRRGAPGGLVAGADARQYVIFMR